jgi:hypothetical protein
LIRLRIDHFEIDVIENFPKVPSEDLFFESLQGDMGAIERNSGVVFRILEFIVDGRHDVPPAGLSWREAVVHAQGIRSLTRVRRRVHCAQQPRIELFIFKLQEKSIGKRTPNECQRVFQKEVRLLRTKGSWQVNISKALAQPLVSCRLSEGGNKKTHTVYEKLPYTIRP